MRTITARCPHCEQTFAGELVAGRSLICTACSQVVTAAVPDWPAGASLHCLACPSHDLFTRKDFPQRLGALIVATGFLASTVAWYFHQIYWTYGILFGTALIDVVLYLVMGTVIECYRCHAEYRGFGERPDQGAFNLETHERYRQQAARRDELSRAANETKPAAG